MLDSVRIDNDETVGESGILDSGLTIEQVKAFIAQTLETSGTSKKNTANRS